MSAPAARPAANRTVRAPGVRLHVEDWEGVGGPLLCLHGQTASGRTFAGLARRLVPEFRVVALDLRGRGQSEAPATGYGYQVHVADALAVVRALGLTRPIIVGHSYGAILGLCLAAWYPDVPGALVLLDGGAPVPPEIDDAVEQLADRLDTTYPSLEAYLGLLQVAPWLQPWTPELADQLASLVEPVSGGVRARARAAHVRQDLRIYRSGPPDYPALWARVSCPTLVVRSRFGFFGQDAAHVLPAADYERMVATIPGARGVEVEANHYTVLLGDPAATAEAVRAFLRQLG